MAYTITEKGTVSIPSTIRKKYNLKRGDKIEFVDTEDGILLIPVVPFEQLFGIDRDRRRLVYRMIHEIHNDRRRRLSDD